MITAIIGANYGDEGKGLAVNYFTRSGKNLVIRHNGGAQSGHTVEVGANRFVFHELSSGSFNRADTYWDYTYHPDLYTLGKEYDDFYALTKIAPTIYCSQRTRITLLDDILLNCFKETHHSAGSCGMGIWECVCRNNAGYSVTVGQVNTMSIGDLYIKLKAIRDNYSIPKLLKYVEMYHNSDNQYKDMLLSDTTLFNYVVEIKNNVKRVRIAELDDLICEYDNIIFEGGQGLLIDGDYDVEHGTPSKTGMHNVASHLRQYGKSINNAVYVTRTYLTRHGKGQFVPECEITDVDATNKTNQWQGQLRYGKFETTTSLEQRITSDCPNITPHLFVTHSNITGGKLVTSEGDIDIGNLNFSRIYVSDNKFTVSDIINK